MKAMILAAGKGTRMRPMTLTTPKPMIPVLNKPVMQLIVEHLRSYKVNDFVVNTSYLADKIQDYFRDGSALGVNIAYSFEGYIKKNNVEGVALGSAGGMKKIQESSAFFDETFIVVCGDAYIDFDVEAMYEFHKSNSAIATILMKDVAAEEVSKYGVIGTDDSGLITQFQEKPDEKDAISTTINTGIYMFDPRIFDFIPADQEFDIGGDLFPKLVEAGEKFFGICQDFQWIDIGSLPDVFSCQTMALNGEIHGFEIPGKQIKPDVHANIHCSLDLDTAVIEGPVYIGAGTVVEPGATIIGPAIIGSNCIVESGSSVVKSFIDDNKRIRSGAVIDSLIIHDKYAIESDGSVSDLQLLRCEWMIDDARNIDEIGEFETLLQEQSRLSQAS